MKRLSFAITIRSDQPLSQILFGNGLSQNIKFFYDLLVLMGHKPYFLVDYKEADSIRFNKKNYHCYTLNEVISKSKPTDIAFEIGVSISQSQRSLLRKHLGTKIISVRYGHSMFMDMEQICHKETMSPGLYVNKPDRVWISPHLKNSSSYLETIYDAPVHSCPYIWEPDFVSNRFCKNDYNKNPDIYVMEPNISLLKNSLIPLAIIEQLYRKHPGSFNKAMILNGLHFNEQEFFLDNIVRNMSSLKSEAKKVYFTGRYKFDEALKNRDILLGHQYGCELNYLYLEALWKGVPLVHNSPSFKSVGYYYPDFDALAGSEKCLEAINNTKVTNEQSKNNEFIKKYSIHNKTVQNQYRQLIIEAITG